MTKLINNSSLEWKMWISAFEPYSDNTYDRDIDNMYEQNSYIPRSPDKLEEFFILADQVIQDHR